MDQFESDLIKNTHEDHKNLRQPIVLDKCIFTDILAHSKSPLEFIPDSSQNPTQTRLEISLNVTYQIQTARKLLEGLTFVLLFEVRFLSFSGMVYYQALYMELYYYI